MIPDRITPMAGWRAWALRGGALVSLNEGVAWPAGEEALARCKGQWWHDAPLRDCSCGLYAHKDRPFEFPNPGFVLGTVALWGRVVEHEHGYRASRAYPQRLWVSDHFGSEVPVSTIVQTLEPYGVPVEVIAAARVDHVLARMVARAIDPGFDTGIHTHARLLADGGDVLGAIIVVLAALRQRDLRPMVTTQGETAMELPGETFLHSRGRQRRCVAVAGSQGKQIVTIVSLEGQHSSYHGVHEVELDTRTGAIVERLKPCGSSAAFPQDRQCLIPRTERVTNACPELALQTWLQLLSWSRLQRPAPAPVRIAMPAARPTASAVLICPTCKLQLHAWGRHRGSYRCYVRSGQIWRDGWIPYAELLTGSELIAAWPAAHRRRWAAVERTVSGQDVSETGSKGQRWYLRSPRRNVDVITLIGRIIAHRKERRLGIKDATDWALNAPRAQLLSTEKVVEGGKRRIPRHNEH